MTIDITTEWASRGDYNRASAEHLFSAGAYPPDVVRHILDAIDADCDAVGFNPGALLGQIATETGWFTYTGDVRPYQYNYGGIGATGGGVPGVSFPTPETGVHGMLAHHGNYLFGSFDRWPVDWRWLQPFAIRNSAVVAAGYGGTVDVVGDYGGGKWAVDPDYAGKIVRRGNQLDATSDRGPGDRGVPQPAIDRSHRSPNRGYNNGFSHIAQSLVWHITQGTNSLGWLCNPASGASANYLLSRDGHIYELVPPMESAWANGDVKNPDTTNALIRQWLATGCNFNQRTVSIECEGFTSYWDGGSLVTPEQIDSLIDLSAWLCDSLAIAPDRTHIIRHQQINDVDRHDCPGFSVEEMDSWIATVADMVGGGGADVEGDVKEPPAGTADQYLNRRGELIAVINFGGTATKILGVNYADVGGSVANAAREEYDRSLQNGVMGEWDMRGDAATTDAQPAPE